MYRFIALLAMAFFIFIIWIITQANSGSNNIFFDIVTSIPYGDKLGHFALFGALTFMCIVGLKFRQFSLGKLKLYIGTTIISVFVLVEELSQLFIPTRTFDFMDLLADFLGIAIATGMATIVAKSVSN